MRTQRRSVLRAVAGAVVIGPALAACDLFKPDEPPAPDPLTEFYNQTLALVAFYQAAALTDARPVVATIRDTHKAHAAALAAIMYPAPPSGSPAPPSAQASPAPAGVREAEQAAWQKAVEACLAAPADRATLLGEIAVARACHLEALA
jgi:hypothetical protein